MKLENFKKVKLLGFGSLTIFVYKFINPIVFGNNISCVCKGTIGVPCPGCGMTRATIALFNGDFDTAFSMHPLIFFLPFFGLIALYLHRKQKNKLLNLFLIFVILIFIVVWLIRMFLFFPHTEPLDYYPNNLVAKLLKLLFNQ